MNTDNEINAEETRGMRNPVLPAHTWGSLFVDTASSEPLYQQLLRQVKALLASGQIAPGVGLPSER